MARLQSTVHVALTCLAMAAPVAAQSDPAQASAAPRLVRLAGTFRPTNGQPAAPVEVVTFAIYADEQGGAPLWSETQNLAVDGEGRYTVLLGATQPTGLPVDLFPGGQARWLGTTFERPDEAEKPRVLLASVPYAVKAADSDTLGGRPASAYVLANQGQAEGSSSGPIGAGQPKVGSVAGDPAGDTLGTANYIGKFINTTDVRNSAIYETGGKVGIGTTTPSDYLHVRFGDTSGTVTGLAVQNTSSAAGSYSGMLFYDQAGALAQFQGFNNSTHEYRINNIASGASINFMTASISRFKVDSAGNVGIGQDTPGYKLDVLHGGSTGIRVKSSASFSVVDIDSATGDSALRFYNNGTSQWNVRNRPADNFFEIFELGGGGSRLVLEDGTGRMVLTGTGATEQLQVNGNIRIGTGTNGCVLDADGTVVAGTCSSDRRFKKDITPFGSVLDRVSRLTPVNYYWRAEEFKDRHFGNTQSYGLIAQDVEEVFPELVKTDDRGYLAVNYSKLPLLTLQAVKDLKAENDDLKARIAALEAAIEALQQK